ILYDWNDTAHAIPAITLPALFEAQVERTPMATALVFEDASLSYVELNRRANQLAHHLIAQGVGPESLVGIALPRSFEMIVSLLGVLKAGAGGLPRASGDPHQRLVFMLTEAQPFCVLTDSAVAAQLSPNIPLLLLDDAS